MPGGTVGVLPGVGGHDAFGRDDLAIDTAHPELLAFRRPHVEPPGAAGAQVGLEGRDREAARRGPVIAVGGIGPGFEDQVARGVDTRVMVRSSICNLPIH